METQRGSAIFMLFIAVALFGMLAFAFTQGTRGNLDMVMAEQNKAQATLADDCTNAINAGIKRLELRGCTGKISYNQDGTNTIAGMASGTCSLYHANGGGVNRGCAAPSPTCSLTSLAIGGNCNGIYYIGDSNGRIYTQATNSGTISFGNGAFGFNNLPGAASTTDGVGNTTYLAGLVNSTSPYKAAQYCRAIGPEWYLPSRTEVMLFYTNKALLPFVTEPVLWASSTQGTSALRLFMSNGIISTANQYNPLAVSQCVRKD